MKCAFNQRVMLVRPEVNVAEPTVGQPVSNQVDIVAILMGWPSLIASLVLASAGAWFRKPAAVWVGLVLILPLAIYVSGSPAYPFTGVVPVIGLVVTAVTCRLPNRWPSLAGVSVYAAFLAWLAFLVVE